MEQPKVAPGVYRHFKGNLYEVIGVARDVDGRATFVIYRPLYGDRELVARRLEEFTETVHRGAEPEPRFRHVAEHIDACHCVADQASKSF